MLRYAATTFLSAFLLFLVQPLIGKYILPWFGGGSGVWTACLLFFQCVLLVGYLYAHLLVTWLKPSRQMIVHSALLIAGLICLPIIPREMFKPVAASQPVLRIVILLAATIGLPYLALSTTGPLLQAWFARTHAGRSPYRLYALSNFGSLLALLGYPFLMEPMIKRPMQAYAWSGGFVAFAGLCAWCAIGQRSAAGESSSQVNAPSPRPSPLADRRNRATAAGQGREGVRAAAAKVVEEPARTTLDRALWVILPMCASIMLLAATNQLSEEIAPMPFVWVLPLAVYLITFIIAFEWPRLYDRRAFTAMAIAAPWLYLAVLIDTHAGLLSQAALYLVVLFSCCMVCHGELYRLRPDAAGRSGGTLTAYYLAISLGGALGGAFVSVIAPLLFTFNVEIYIALFGSIALLGACLWRDARSPFFKGANRPAWLGLLLILAIAGLLIRLAVSADHAGTVLRTRSFYGSLAVRETRTPTTGTPIRKLMHGRITHGSQSLDPSERYHPLTYYTPSSGVGRVMKAYPKGDGRRIAVVGLGAGTMAAWGERGDVIRFYEINPQVAHIAQTSFTFLQDSRAKTEIIMGDGRLSMEREQPQNYDIIVLDAFSGDAVPMHLLTREAFAVYKRHLKPGGVIAVNVTNRYLELHPVVHRVALDAGFHVAMVLTDEVEPEMVSASHWMLVTTNQELLTSKGIAEANVLAPGAGPPHVSLWTDDFCSVLEVLRR